MTMLAGPSGKGKSFVALDWALSLASGSPWLGRRARRRRVLYVAAEGAHGQKWRVRAWREGHPNAASPDRNVRFLAHAVQFGSPDELGELTGAARNFDVIILDTLAGRKLPRLMTLAEVARWLSAGPRRKRCRRCWPPRDYKSRA